MRWIKNVLFRPKRENKKKSTYRECFRKMKPIRKECVFSKKKREMMISEPKPSIPECSISKRRIDKTR
mgnify:CR=1 FL=1